MILESESTSITHDVVSGGSEQFRVQPLPDMDGLQLANQSAVPLTNLENFSCIVRSYKPFSLWEYGNPLWNATLVPLVGLGTMPGVGPMGAETWIVDGSPGHGSWVDVCCYSFVKILGLSMGVTLNVGCFVSVQVWCEGEICKIACKIGTLWGQDYDPQGSYCWTLLGTWDSESSRVMASLW